MPVTRRGKLIIALLILYLWVMTGWALHIEGGRTNERKSSQTYTQEGEKPVNKPAAKPAKSRAADIPSRGGSRYVSRGGNYGLSYKGNFVVTAYCPCEKCTGKEPGDPGYRQVAVSTPTRPVFAQEGRTIAADWAVLPPGTEVSIEGIPGTFTVEDNGGAIDGLKLDRYFEKHSDALAWGKKYRKVWIYRGDNSEPQTD